MCQRRQMRIIARDADVIRNVHPALLQYITQHDRHDVIGTDNSIRLFSFAGQDLRSKPCGTVLPEIAVHNPAFRTVCVRCPDSSCDSCIGIRISLKTGKTQEPAAPVLFDQVNGHIIKCRLLRDLYRFKAIGTAARIDTGNACIPDMRCDLLFQCCFHEILRDIEDTVQSDCVDQSEDILLSCGIVIIMVMGIGRVRHDEYIIPIRRNCFVDCFDQFCVQGINDRRNKNADLFHIVTAFFSL